VTNYADRGDWRNAAHGYRDQRDRLQAEVERLRAVMDAVLPVRRAWDNGDLIATPEGHEHLNALCAALDSLNEG
jgi:hypothetical protein